MTTINDLDSQIVKDFNRQLFELLVKTVTAKDESQLKKIIDNIKSSVQ